MNSINLDALKPYQKRMGNAFVVDMIKTYLENSPALLDAIHASFPEKNQERFTRAAHNLKSNSATLGAEKLAALCETLEQAGLAGRIDPSLRPELETLTEEHRRACHELTQLLVKTPGD